MASHHNHVASELVRLGHQNQLIYSVQRIGRKFHLSDAAGSQIPNVPAGAKYLPCTSPIGHQLHMIHTDIFTVEGHQIEQSAICYAGYSGTS